MPRTLIAVAAAAILSSGATAVAVGGDDAGAAASGNSTERAMLRELQKTRADIRVIRGDVAAVKAGLGYSAGTKSQAALLAAICGSTEHAVGGSVISCYP